jgi:hypothetical protein
VRRWQAVTMNIVSNDYPAGCGNTARGGHRSSLINASPSGPWRPAVSAKALALVQTFGGVAHVDVGAHCGVFGRKVGEEGVEEHSADAGASMPGRNGWVHFSHLWNDGIPKAGPGEVVEVTGGVRKVFEGETVDFDWETPGQEGYDFRAVNARPRGRSGPSQVIRHYSVGEYPSFSASEI